MKTFLSPKAKMNIGRSEKILNSLPAIHEIKFNKLTLIDQTLPVEMLQQNGKFKNLINLWIISFAH